MIINNKIVLVLFLYFNAYSLFGQTSNSLMKYYEFVNQAELDIVNNKIPLAYSKYKEAFKIKEIPFELDHYNFAICCAILKKNHESFKHVKFLVEYGYSIDSLFKNDELKYLKKNKWKKKIYSISKKYDHKLKIKLDSLLNLDQKFRIIDKIKYKDTIFKIDSLNANTIIKNKNLFSCFSESKIGLDLTPLRIIIMHNFQNLTFGRDLNSLHDLLKACVYSGEIDVRKAAYYLQGYNLENFGASFRGITRYGFIYYEEGIEKLSKLSDPGIPDNPITNEIDLNRRKIGLCSIDDYLRKIKFNYYNKSFRFTNSTDRSNIYFATKEDYDKAIQNFIFLE